MRDSIETPLPAIQIGSFGSKKRRESIIREERESVGRSVVVMARLEGSDETMNAGSIERRNQSPVQLTSCRGEFGDQVVPARPLWRTKSDVWGFGTVGIARD